MSGGDQYATIADVIRIVESAEVLSNTDGEKPRVTALSLRVPREQPDASPPSEGKSAEPKCTCPCHDLASPWRHSDGKCLNCPNDRPGHGVAQDASEARLEARLVAKLREDWIREENAQVGSRDAAAAPACGRATPAPQRGTATGALSEAEDDEAWRIAVSQCHTRYNALRCAEDIRALVAEREAAARTVERKAAFAFVEHLPEVHYIRKHFAGQLDEACADAIEREGGKGR